MPPSMTPNAVDSAQAGAHAAMPAPNDLASAIKTARLRLGPFLALMFAISILDRSNVGFAKEALKTDVHIGDAAYALGAGLFFISYALFEVPSNLILRRVGAKIWLSRIMVTWGIASAAMMLVHSNVSFCMLRFLVGAAEAGFSPGVVLYTTYWFPSRERGKVLGIYYMGVPAALMFGSALSGFLMQTTDGLGGLHNWQWMFLLEGLLASVVGVFAFFYLTSKPRDAAWLTPAQRHALVAALAEEETRKEKHCCRFAILKDAQLLYFVAIYFAIQVGIYAVIFYLPSRIALLEATKMNSRIGILVAIPWLCALLCLPTITGFADRRNMHRFTAAAMLFIAALGTAASTRMTGLWPALAAFSIAAVGYVIVQPLFWTLPTAHFSGAASASGIAVIGAIGNLGGFVAPILKTVAEEHCNNQSAGSAVLALIAGVGVLLIFGAGRSRSSTTFIT